MSPADTRNTWGTQALWSALLPLLPDLSIEVVERLESTNQSLMDRLREAARKTPGKGIRANDLAPSLLVAVLQTQGRGRLGRSWVAVPGASLTFSLSLPIRRPDVSGLSLAVGWAVAEALDPSGHEIGLKWPNDLWRLDAPGHGRKLGGVLIEALQVGDERMVVIGIGVNLRPLLMTEAVASLSEFDADVAAPEALQRIMPRLAQALVDFERDGFAGVAAAFARRDLLRGHAVTTTDPACPEGLAVGVADDGALLVQAGGRVSRIVGGEVSVRPVGPGPLPDACPAAPGTAG